MLLIADIEQAAIENLLGRFRLDLVIEDDGAAITGSFWGDSEAGIVGDKVYVRRDTPVHSLLHETGHVICMTADRRSGLERDAGGDDLEEAAVCYLQIILADQLKGVGRTRLMRDMDSWGYSFRLGNTRDWFEQDAEDAKAFLKNHGLMTAAGQPSFKLR